MGAAPMPTYAVVLIHSPICDRLTWAWVAQYLRPTAATVVPDLHRAAPPPFWRTYAAEVATQTVEALGDDTPVVLVAHSGAGQLLAHCGQAFAERDHVVVGYVLADAGLPPGRDSSRLQQLELDLPVFAIELQDTFARGGHFPDWDDVGLQPLVSDQQRRDILLAGVHQLPEQYWTETIPEVPGWPDAPVGALLFSDGYPKTVETALRRGWPLRELHTDNHFLNVDQGELVAFHLRSLIGELLHPRR